MSHRYFTLVTLPLLLAACGAAPMQAVRVSPDNKGFVLVPSGLKFTPWGHNYAAEGLEDPAQHSWAKIEGDFVEMKNMRANVARIHLQFPKFMDGPDKPNAAALKRLSELLELAEKHGLYLDLTGLACYRPQERAAWYDAMSDKDRWATQARFWETIRPRVPRARPCSATTWRTNRSCWAIGKRVGTPAGWADWTSCSVSASTSTTARGMRSPWTGHGGWSRLSVSGTGST